jgi:hypothetical protein
MVVGPGPSMSRPPLTTFLSGRAEHRHEVALMTWLEDDIYNV